MMIELCQSYIDAINIGSVPNIESAWQSLCKNENLRAMQNAILSYEKQMDQGLYKNP